MPQSTVVRTPDLAALSDQDLAELARQGEREAFRQIMQRYNRRIYRVARAILKDESDAEDVVQETYLRAFIGLEGFRRDSTLATWLTRIAVNEALGRLRRIKPSVDLSVLDRPEERSRMSVVAFPSRSGIDPEQASAESDVRRVLERAVDELPEHFRVVFVMRDVEEMSVEETAAQLGLRPETVRTRLHRARAQLRAALRDQITSALTDTFPFAGERCARLTEVVLGRLPLCNPSTTPEEEQNR